MTMKMWILSLLSASINLTGIEKARRRKRNRVKYNGNEVCVTEKTQEKGKINYTKEILGPHVLYGHH